MYQKIIIFDQNFGKMSIGSRVRKYRDNKMLSQSDLAIMTEVSQSAISSLESDKSIPNSVMLHRIAYELEVDINDLLRDENVTHYHSERVSGNNNQKETTNISQHQNIIKTILLNQEKITCLIEKQNGLMELLLKKTP